MKLIINTHFDIFIYHFYFRSQKFRKSFKEIKTLRTFMPNAVRLGLSGTITENDKNALCRSLGFSNTKFHSVCPDRPNIFLEKIKRLKRSDVFSVAANIYEPLCNELKEKLHISATFSLRRPVLNKC